MTPVSTMPDPNELLALQLAALERRLRLVEKRVFYEDATKEAEQLACWWDDAPLTTRKEK